MKEIKRITSYGSGKMGKGIAILFARKDYPICIWTHSRKAETIYEEIRQQLKFLADNEIICSSQIEPIIDKITVTHSVEEAALFGDLIIESISEDLSLKQDCFEYLDKICPPETILASNTSVMSITEIGSKVKHKERVLGTHFWNPAFLIPLVEVIKTEFVSDNAVESVYELLKAAGKKPIIVNKDVPGFIANRLQHAVGREAWAILQNGLASAEDIDIAMKYGPGMRYCISAPMEQGDSVGLDLALRTADYLYPYLDNSTKAHPIMREKVAKGELGFKANGVGVKKWTQEEMDKYNQELINNLVKIGKLLNRF